MAGKKGLRLKTRCGEKRRKAATPIWAKGSNLKNARGLVPNTGECLTKGEKKLKTLKANSSGGGKWEGSRARNQNTFPAKKRGKKRKKKKREKEKKKKKTNKS